MKWANESRWDHLVREASRATSVPVWAIKATIAQESGFNPKAFRAEPAINDASRGLMQLLHRTARGLGYTGPAGDDVTKLGGLYAPLESIRLGSEYLKNLRLRFPGETWPAIYAAYNSGAVRRNAAGQFTNSKGLLTVQQNVSRWTDKADYFRQLEGLAPLEGPPAAAGSAG